MNCVKTCPKITDIVPQKGQNYSIFDKIDLAIIYDAIFYSALVDNHPLSYHYMSMFVLLAY